jgi:hypothetical protein
VLLALRSLVEAGTASGAGSSTGADTAIGVGAWLQSGVGSSSGSNTATAVGAWTQAGVGSSAGSNTSTATTSWLQSGVGSSAGTDTVAGTGAWLQAGVGTSAGTDTASAVGSGGDVTVSGVGVSVGGNVALGQAPASDFNNDYDQSFGGYPGADTGLGQGDFNNDFNGDFAVFHVGQVVSGKGESVGGNIATGVGSTVVFIPPVYPPPPPIPVQVWHPAQEYHRVQAPRATRVYRRGTELQRRPPQGMKRRYG